MQKIANRYCCPNHIHLPNEEELEADAGILSYCKGDFME
jgi:hypothetical protein